jgi:hypothetical protein
MFEPRPDIVERYIALQGLAARGGSALGMLTVPRRTRPTWGQVDGLNLLLRWQGDEIPLPTLDPGGARPAEIVGLASADAEQIETFADVTHAADTVYHYAIVQLGGGGVATRINPFEVQTRVFDSGGSLLGYMPNAPDAPSVRMLADGKPYLTWTYSTFKQQAPPAMFNVYVTDGASDFDFGTPTAQVAYEPSRTRYDWTQDALSPGDVRYYTVRAESAAGVKSLIPRLGLCPSGDYNWVSKGRCPVIQIPAGPPAEVENLHLEVVR